MDLSSRSRSRGPSLSVRDRAFSVASTSSNASLKRKPLPASASPLATKFIEPVPVLPPPEQPFVRLSTGDSPTLYEFPPTAANAFSAPAFSPRNSSLKSPSSPASSPNPPRKSSLKPDARRTPAVLDPASTESPLRRSPVTATKIIPPSITTAAPSKLGAFFGWTGNSSPVSPTNFSGKIAALPARVEPPKTLAPTAPTPPHIDVLKANAAGGYFSPRLTPTLPADVLDMENELREISAELAGSIRREMELEDLVERLQTEAQNPSVPGRRTSDYFSDSGTSSVRYGESDSRADDLERLQRKAEQEKAGIRLELTTKVQDERAMRKKLEVSIRELEERASQSNSTDSTGRLKELESTCEDLRRRLADERQAKDNFEDLLTALKLELQGAHAECDNLRDEVVPQLRARVEGLEAQTTQHERLAYDHTKVQQELKLLKEQSSPHPDMHKFNAIAENMPTRSSVAMSRSNSLAQASRSPLSRSTSIKTVESRETLVERVKEIEMQRDSLHRALKSLLERQDLQNKDYQKRIRQLEMERDKTVTGSPRRGGYNKEVERLRAEVNSLRRRADEAIEQKWQCEKGLSGLKMDLDRAEQEIESLKMLLHEKDILLAHGGDAGPAARPRSSEVSSEALEHAYKELQKAYVESLDRIQELQHSPQDTETAQALQQLRQSLQAAVSEQHLARREVESLQQQTIQLRQAEKSHVKEEQLLAESLRESAVRVESLAAEVRQQLSTNATLRNRLAETIERGELEQQSNAHKITSMQTHLKFLEDALLQAQQASEDAITRHEGELRKVRETQHSQLQRTKDTPRTFSPKSPLSPRLARTTSDSAMSVSESSKVAQLEKKVAQLEHALAEADTEMGDVIGRMNIAQVEVMDLQNHREEAVRETRRLQKELEMERLRVFEGGWASVSGGASGAAAARRAA